MNVASLELSEELYELSGWNDTEYDYCRNSDSEWSAWNQSDQHERSYPGFKRGVPAYDLGHLLRKLPPYTLIQNVQERWKVYAEGQTIFSETSPEDAAAELAIELFKQGVLTRGGDA